MGSRAGIIVIDAAGAVELFYDHWAAQTLGLDAALAGFESTLERVRSMEPMGEPSVQEWTSATWMEGAMLIDIPNRRVVWSEEGEALVLPRIVSHLIEQTWPGWTAIWAPEGIHGVIQLAGADPELLFADRRVAGRGNLADYEWFEPGSDQFTGAPLSVRLDSGEVVLRRTDADLDSIAGHGPDKIVAFAHHASDQGACGDGWGSDWGTRRRGWHPSVGGARRSPGCADAHRGVVDPLRGDALRWGVRRVLAGVDGARGG